MISYGGIPLRDSPPEVAAWLMATMPPQEAFGFPRFRRLSDPAMDPRAHLAWFLSRPTKLHTFYYPWGASRWGIAYGLIGQEGLDAIRAQAYADGEYTALPFVMDDQVNGVMQTDLFMLPAIPLTGAPLNATDTAQLLYLLVMVDERYLWWTKSAAIDITEGTTTWASLFTAIGTALGVSIDLDAVPAAYLKPGRGLVANYEYLPMLLDRAAASVGRRLVRRLDGTYHLIEASAALTSSDTQAALYIRKSGGSLDLDTDGLANVPASVVVRFPRMANPAAGELVHTVEVTLDSLSLDEYADASGRAGKELLHSSAVAPYTGGLSPVNSDEATALAEQMATDFYLWRRARFEASLRSVVPWNPTANEDIEWNHHGTATLIHRTVWEPEFGEMEHAGQFGSRHGLQYQLAPTIRIVTGTPTDSVFDAKIRSRNNVTGAWADVASCWVRDLSAASSLAADAQYNAVFAGVETGPGSVVRSLYSINTTIAGAAFPARIFNPKRLYTNWVWSWVEQTIDTTTGGWIDKPGGRSGTSTDGPFLFEMNNNFVCAPAYTRVWLRGTASGQLVYEFDRCCETCVEQWYCVEDPQNDWYCVEDPIDGSGACCDTVCVAFPGLTDDVCDSAALIAGVTLTWNGDTGPNCSYYAEVACTTNPAQGNVSIEFGVNRNTGYCELRVINTRFYGMPARDATYATTIPVDSWFCDEPLTLYFVVENGDSYSNWPAAVTIVPGTCPVPVWSGAGYYCLDTPAGSGSGPYVFDHTGTFTIPIAGIWKLTGVGGGGGGAGGSPTHGGGGGGGGGVFSTSHAYTVGDVVPFTVGTGGAGGAVLTDGTAGTNSTVEDAIGYGGAAGYAEFPFTPQGGIGGAGGGFTDGILDPFGEGSVGGNGGSAYQTELGGGGGGAGGDLTTTGAVGTDAVSIAGGLGAASTIDGVGGNGGNAGVVGHNATGHGGNAGGGGGNNAAGGNGGGGFVSFEYLGP